MLDAAAILLVKTNSRHATAQPGVDQSRASIINLVNDSLSSELVAIEAHTQMHAEELKGWLQG